MNKKNIDTYLYGNIYPRWVVLLVDLFIIVLSFVFAFFVYLGNNAFSHLFIFTSGIITVLSINLICLCLFKIPSRVLRYSSFSDFVRIVIAQTCAIILLLVIAILFKNLTDIQWLPLEMLPIVYVMGMVLLISLRIIVKTAFEFRHFGERDTIRVMIYAAEYNCADIVRRLRNDNKSRYRIRGFISDNPKMSGRYLMAIPIYMNNDKLLGMIDERGTDAVVLDSEKMKVVKNSELTDQLLARSIRLITLSPIEELKKNKQQGNSPSIRNIMIEDLMMRNPIKMDLDNTASLFRKKRVMITGAAGSIGRELLKQISAFQPEMFILIDQAETPMHDVRLMMEEEFSEINTHTIVSDITNKSRMESLFVKYRPQYVFHIAAYKHIPMLEVDVSEAVQVNIMGTCNLADLAVQYKAEKFVLASTDKAINPTSVMGVSKRIAEMYIQSLAKTLNPGIDKPIKFIITRFGNVLDSEGSVFYRFKEQIAKKETLIVTHPDVVRYFITTREVVSLILETCSLNEDEILYAFNMGNPVKIIDLAKRMISLSGYIPGKDIKIEFAGLRSGEKLKEDPIGKEKYLPVKHENILIISDSEYNYNEINSEVRKLIVYSYEGNVSHIMNSLKKLVPEFVSNECNCDKFIINN